MYKHINIFTQRERRLCRLKADLEAVSNRITEQLSVSDPTSIETARVLLDSVPDEDQPAVLQKLEQRIQGLDTPLIATNLKLLATRVNRQGTRAGLEQLRQRLETPTPEPDKALLLPVSADSPPATSEQPRPLDPAQAEHRSWGEQAKDAVGKAYEWTKDTAKETYQEVNSWSTQKKLLVGAGVIGGVLAARWLWKKTFGKKDSEQPEPKKEGSWLSRNWTLIPGLGLLALVGYGAYRLYNRSKGIQDTVGGAIDTAGKVLNAGQDALAKSLERLGPAANVLWEHPHTKEVLKNWDHYANDTERNNALIAAIAQDGLDFTVQGGTCVLSENGNVLKCTGQFWGDIGRAFIHREWPDGTELFVTWINGIPAYAISLAGLKVITLGRMRTAGIVQESLLWPIYSVKRISKAGWTVATVMQDGTRSNLIARRMVAGAYRKTVLQLGHLNVMEKGVDNVILRADMTRKQIQLLNEARAHGKLEPELMNRFEKNVNKYVEELAEYLRELDPKTVEALPDHLQTLHKQVQGMTGKVEYEAIKKQLFQGQTEAAGATTAPRTAPETPGTVPEPAAASTTEAAAAESGAVEGRAAKTAARRAGRLGRLSKPLRTLTKIMGPAAVAFSGYEALSYYALGGKAKLQQELQNETDPIRRQILEQEMTAAERGLSIDGAGSIAVLFPPTAVPATAVLLTKAAVDTTGMRASIVKGATYVDLKREDLVHQPDGAILDTIAQSSSGQLATYGQWIASESAIAGVADGQGSARASFEAGNTNARSEAYAAYFLRLARIPTVHAEELPPAERQNPEQAAKQITIIEQDLAAFHVEAALSYIKRATRGSFTSVDATLLERAQLFAILATMSQKQLRLGNKHVALFGTLSVPEQEAAIDELKAVQADAFLDHMAQQAEAGMDRSQALAPLLLESLRHDLALYDAKIREEDYSDWSLSGIGHWTNDAEGARLARSMVANRISQAVVRMGTQQLPQTPEEYQSLVESLRQELRFTPDELAKQGLISPERGPLARAGADENVITPEGILKMVKLGVIDRKPAQAS